MKGLTKMCQQIHHSQLRDKLSTSDCALVGTKAVVEFRKFNANFEK